MSRRKSRRRAEPKRTTRPAPIRKSAAQPDRKTLQLCEQVKEALSWIFGSATADDRLTLCHVQAVEPLGKGNRLLVKVAVPPDISVAAVIDRLAEAAPVLRSEVAQSITRRKVPELVYMAVPTG